MPTHATVPDSILESVHSLPPLPAAVNRLLVLTCDPDADFRQIIRVIESDQTLTARTLRTANSSLYSVPRRIQTVQQAVTLLGQSAITNMALGISVVSAQAGMKEWPVDSDAFARHSIAVALLARTLAERLRLPQPEEAFVAGLLHDIGKLALLNHSGGLYVDLLRTARRGQQPLHQLERDVFKTDHGAVGAALCAHWNIPDSLAHAVAAHHAEACPDPDTVAAVVRDANDLVKAFQIGDGVNAYVDLRPSRRPRHRTPSATLYKLLLELPAKVREMETALGSSPEAGGIPEEPEMPFEERPRVHLQIAAPEQQELVALSVLSMGYRPVPVEDAASGAPTDVPPVGLIGEGAEPSAQRAACEQRGLPVLDFAAWRREHGQPAEGQVNLVKLREWLASGLLNPTGPAASACKA